MVQAEYDPAGEITAFYVKWEETDHFPGKAQGARLYRISRTDSQILFGDGIRVRIPRCTKDVAFRVIRKTTRGSLGNVKAGSIDGFYGNVPFVQSVSNPSAATGGSDMEERERVWQKSANLFSGRGRIVSETDFVRETLMFSRQVAQAVIICGVDRWGRHRDGQIGLVVLMRDYLTGTDSFYRLREQLMPHLCARCEPGCRKALHIELPVFVEVSVNVWLSEPAQGDVLAACRQWEAQIAAYLQPDDGSGHGWRIGDFPGEGQIRMMLHGMEGDCRMERYTVNAAVRDAEGLHELSLEKAGGNPFAVCCSGVQKVMPYCGTNEEGRADSG